MPSKTPALRQYSFFMSTAFLRIAKLLLFPKNRLSSPAASREIFGIGGIERRRMSGSGEDMLRACAALGVEGPRPSKSCDDVDAGESTSCSASEARGVPQICASRCDSVACVVNSSSEGMRSSPLAGRSRDGERLCRCLWGLDALSTADRLLWELVEAMGGEPRDGGMACEKSGPERER